jgi:hypothetical protein
MEWPYREFQNAAKWGWFLGITLLGLIVLMILLKQPWLMSIGLLVLLFVFGIFHSLYRFFRLTLTATDIQAGNSPKMPLTEFDKKYGAKKGQIALTKKQLNELASPYWPNALRKDMMIFGGARFKPMFSGIEWVVLRANPKTNPKHFFVVVGTRRPDELINRLNHLLK